MQSRAPSLGQSHKQGGSTHNHRAGGTSSSCRATGLKRKRPGKVSKQEAVGSSCGVCEDWPPM